MSYKLKIKLNSNYKYINYYVTIIIKMQHNNLFFLFEFF